MKKKEKTIKNIRVLCSSAVLSASAVIIAYFCQIFLTFGPICFTVENLPIILSGYLFGPVAGMITGLIADLVSTLLSGYAVNPIIALGAASVGFFAGLPYSKKSTLRLVIAVFMSHITGNMIIKSAGLMIYFDYSIITVLPRIPLYIGISAVEFILLFTIIKSNALRRSMGGKL